jgi:ubiquinone/menaquinone biosynthesis C-methylase UbiE
MSFDQYANDYREIINRVSRLSGETYESIITLRMAVLQDELGEQLCGTRSLEILDFGCGTGITEQYLLETFPDCSITGIDASAESIRLAEQQELKGVSYIHCDSPHLPCPDRSFDLIYTNGTMHHIPAVDRINYLTELNRVLKPGGALCIFENNPRNPLTVRSMRQNPFDANLTAVEAKGLLQLAAIVGLESVAVRYYFFFPRLLEFLRGMERQLKRIPLGAQYLLHLRRTST